MTLKPPTIQSLLEYFRLAILFKSPHDEATLLKTCELLEVINEIPPEEKASDELIDAVDEVVKNWMD